MNGTKTSPSAIFSRGGKSKGAPLRVLCVEDNDGDYHLLAQYLREGTADMSLDLARATSLADALAQLRNSESCGIFHLILLDLSLPDSHGMDTYHRMKESAPHTAVMILSGNDDKDLALEIMQRGAQDYLPKNALTPDLIIRSILYAVRRQHYRSELEQVNDRLKRATHDLQTAQMQLIQVEKLDSLGRIAAGVAHEVKNPLCVLQMGVDYFARAGEGMNETSRLVLGNMQDAIKRADTIIREMVDFSRSDQFEVRPICVNDLVERALRMVHHEMVKRSIVLQKELTTDVPSVEADAGKLEQVIINILMNAIQAMPNGETLKVRTHWAKIEEAERDEGLREMNRLREGDDVVVIEIRDHGPGIATDNLNRVFEPFFTTKPTGEGSGLGLSVARKIIELHRGSLQIQNVVNPPGLRVRIILKSHHSTAEPSLRQKLASQPT